MTRNKKTTFRLTKRKCFKHLFLQLSSMFKPLTKLTFDFHSPQGKYITAAGKHKNSVVVKTYSLLSIAIRCRITLNVLMQRYNW